MRTWHWLAAGGAFLVWHFWLRNQGELLPSQYEDKNKGAMPAVPDPWQALTTALTALSSAQPAEAPAQKLTAVNIPAFLKAPDVALPVTTLPASQSVLNPDGQLMLSSITPVAPAAAPLAPAAPVGTKIYTLPIEQLGSSTFYDPNTGNLFSPA